MATIAAVWSLGAPLEASEPRAQTLKSWDRMSGCWTLRPYRKESPENTLAEMGRDLVPPETIKWAPKQSLFSITIRSSPQSRIAPRHVQMRYP